MHPSKLKPAHAIEIDALIARSGQAYSTNALNATNARKILHWFREVYKAQKLDHLIRRYPGVRPRNVVATREEIEMILNAAQPGLRLWLLLCSDLGMRSGTAAVIGAQHWDAGSRMLRFTTKFHAALTLPATAAVESLIAQCRQNSPEPFVSQLWPAHRRGRPRKLGQPIDPDTLHCAFNKLLADLKITRRIIPHDLRRTAAVSMLEHTRDIRDVQALLGHSRLSSTLHYLDHDLVPVKRSTLELIKRPSWAEKRQA